jgi:hypothetical protein
VLCVGRCRSAESEVDARPTLLWLSSSCLLVGGHDMDGPLRLGGQTLIKSRQQRVLLGDGRRVDNRSARGDSRLVGQAVPEMVVSVGGGEEVVVDLAGDVTLQAADDFGLGLAFFRPAFDVVLSGLMRAEAGEDDAP